MFWTLLLQRLKRAKIRKQFELQRDLLREQFLSQLRATPEGSTADWHDVEWITEPIIFVRQDRVEPHFALVGISAFAPPAQGKSEGASQAGTAIFQFETGAWSTTGQFLHNLTPSEAHEKLMNRFMQPGW
jgi:hypothetical protein